MTAATGMRPADIALGASATLIWAAAFLATSVGLGLTSPLLFGALRFAVTAAFIVVVPRPRVGWRALLAIGLSIGVGQHAGIFLGMASGVTPGMAALLAHTQSFFTLGLAWILFGETLSSRGIAAFALAFAGLALLIVERGAPMPIAAILMVLGGAISAALGNLVLRRLGGVDPLGVTAWMSVIAAPSLLLLSVATEGPAPALAVLQHWTPTLLLAMSYSGVLAGLVAYAIWVRLFGRYRAHQVAPFMLLVPVGAIALSALFLDEQLSVWRLGAAAAILIGLALNASGRSTQPRAGAR